MFHAPADVFLGLGGVGKTNKALEAVDVNSVSHQGQQMTMQTAAGLWRRGGQRELEAAACLRLDQQLGRGWGKPRG